MIEKKEQIFFLHTENTSYLIGIHPSGCLEHLYYGKRIRTTAHASALWGRSAFLPGNCVALDQKNPQLSTEELRQECSSTGKGDVREPMIEVVFPDGSRTADFRYVSYEIRENKTMPKTLPGCLEGENVRELRLHLRDRKTEDSYSGLELTLIYDVYEDTDTIVRRAVLHNYSKKSIRIERALSLQLDLRKRELNFHTFGGPWTAEMQHEIQKAGHARLVNSSFCGVSSNRSNPFVMLSDDHATEHQGDCYGMNLVYSGNHYSSVERSSFGDLRFLMGINPQDFSWKLRPNTEFETPEAVTVYSSRGFQGMSQSMHRFIRNYVVRGEWKNKPRPILLNSWEAAYFKITESKLLSMAKAGKDAGMELFVMDDGWFKGRSTDTSSLGDWTADEKKLPNGVSGLARKIHDLGMQFGIWVEPEMVNEDSDLFRTHPEWALRIPDRAHSEGRNQMLLDLTRKEVRDYIISAMRKVFGITGIDYVKWDMNRIFSDVYSEALPAWQQGEVFHRYVLGLYEIVDTLTKEFPHILFEGCASGGNRFDLGMLCYMPQIWASDDTDAYARAWIQQGYSYGYPQSVYSAHVSGVPNHQTLRSASMEARFGHASFGVLGYECNPAELSSEDKKKVKEQISFYKEYRELFQYGSLYRLPCEEADEVRWMVVSEDKKTAIAMLMKGLSRPNRRQAVLFGAGLDPEMLYHVTNLRTKFDVREFGSLVNTMAPVHIRQDSLAHKALAAVVRMDSEKEDVLVPGDLLMEAGIHLSEAYSGVGYSDQVRLARDFETRMYLFEGKE